MKLPGRSLVITRTDHYFIMKQGRKDNLQVVRLPKKKCYIILYMSWDKQDLREKLRV